MGESEFTKQFLNVLVGNLRARLGPDYNVIKRFSLKTRKHSAGFEVDIGIESKYNNRLTLIEIEIMGKTPIYNLMKTIYWYSFQKDKSPFKLLFIHVFSNPQKHRDLSIQQDLEEFADKEFLIGMMDYEQINFPQIVKLLNIENQVDLLKLHSGKNFKEIKQLLKKNTINLAFAKEKDLMENATNFQTIFLEHERGKNEIKRVRKDAIYHVIKKPIQELTDKICKMMENYNLIKENV